MCIAEAPGRHESEDGIVLHPKADAGMVFDRALGRAKVQRDSLTLSNVCWQRPPNNELANTPYLTEAKEYWMPFNEQLIRERHPKVIVLLGNISLGAFTEFGRTDKTTIQHLQGYSLIDPVRESYLLPSLHPSFILHGQQAHTQTLIWTLQRAFQLAREGLKILPTRYVTHPTESDMLLFESGFDPFKHILAYDIETPESSKLDEAELEDSEEDISYNILRASLCYDGESGYAISFPWQAPFIEVAQRMLATFGRKEVFNGAFDNPRLRAAGCAINGRIYDRMHSWKYLQPTLPASLEYCSPLLGWTNPPWKYLSESDPALYSCIDAHALRHNGMVIEEALKARGVFDQHEKYVIEVFEVLTQMSKNGLPYDAQAAAQFKIKLEKLKVEREVELQGRVPESLKPVKQAKGYKKTPKSTEGCVARKFHLKWDELTEMEQAFIKRDLSAGPPNAEERFEVERWAKLKPFLPTSHKQMKDLIRWGGFKVGTNRKTKKETSDDETKRKIIARCINSSRKKDQEFGETLKMCREVSQLSKVLGTYVKGYRPKADGRIHATPGFWGKMHRVSWRNPNISATIQDKTEGAIAAGFRKCIATGRGRLLSEYDWKGIEAVLVGHFAGDPDYMRLAKIGVHDYFCSHILASKGKIAQSDIPSLSLSDAELKPIFSKLKKSFPKDRDDSKHIIHGTAYGMTPPLMSSLYELPMSEAERLQNFYFELFPKVKLWQESVKKFAHEKVWLKTPFGFSMPFWEIYRWNSRRYEILAKTYDRIGKMGPDGMPWKPNMKERSWIKEIEQILHSNPQMKPPDAISKLCWDLGDDAKSAISFLPRDTAAGMLRKVIRQLRPLADEGILVGCAHDAVLCDHPESELDRVSQVVHSTMTAPFPELDGLSIDVEAKAGPAWDSENMEVFEVGKRLAFSPALS
jgi:uracil-DNA glycosylase family 4